MTGHKDFPLTITRTLNAPRNLVWDCYSKLEHLEKWWGPAGFEWLSGTLDFRPGGKFHYGMRAPNGQEMWGRFVYREIKAPERMEFLVSFSDASGGLARPSFPGMDDYPDEVINRLTLKARGNLTDLILEGGPHNATPKERKFFEGMLPSMNQGFSGTFAQLEAYLEKLKG
jgi:uncharacterized protein YndB with AHSA1/START domain